MVRKARIPFQCCGGHEAYVEGFVRKLLREARVPP